MFYALISSLKIEERIRLRLRGNYRNLKICLAQRPAPDGVYVLIEGEADGGKGIVKTDPSPLALQRLPMGLSTRVTCACSCSDCPWENQSSSKLPGPGGWNHSASLLPMEETSPLLLTV